MQDCLGGSCVQAEHVRFLVQHPLKSKGRNGKHALKFQGDNIMRFWSDTGAPQSQWIISLFPIKMVMFGGHTLFSQTNTIIRLIPFASCVSEMNKIALPSCYGLHPCTRWTHPIQLVYKLNQLHELSR